MDFTKGTSYADATRIAASGMSAQRLRLNLISSNLANAETTRTTEGGPYRRKDAIFTAKTVAGTFGDMLSELQEEYLHGVDVNDVVESDKYREVHNPSHPDANAEGYVRMPDINVVEEMVDMLQATRGYEANVQAIKALKAMATQAINIAS